MRISQARDFIPANYNRILLSSRHVLCDISGDGPERADADGVGDFHGRRQARAVSVREVHGNGSHGTCHKVERKVFSSYTFLHFQIPDSRSLAHKIFCAITIIFGMKIHYVAEYGLRYEAGSRRAMIDQTGLG